MVSITIRLPQEFLKVVRIHPSPVLTALCHLCYNIFCMFPNRRDTDEVTVVFPDCTITGTRGSDNLVGTSGADVICGLDGDKPYTAALALISFWGTGAMLGQILSIRGLAITLFWAGLPKTLYRDGR